MKRVFLIPLALVLVTVLVFTMLNNASEARANEQQPKSKVSTKARTSMIAEFSAEIIECDDDIFLSEVIDKDGNIKCDKPFIIDFNATWCGPCKKLRPVLEKIQTSYGNRLQIFSVDVDRCKSYTDFFDFEYIPYLVFVDESGNRQEMVGGGLTETQLRQYIHKYLHLD